MSKIQVVLVLAVLFTVCQQTAAWLDQTATDTRIESQHGLGSSHGQAHSFVHFSGPVVGPAHPVIVSAGHASHAVAAQGAQGVNNLVHHGVQPIQHRVQSLHLGVQPPHHVVHPIHHGVKLAIKPVHPVAHHGALAIQPVVHGDHHAVHHVAQVIPVGHAHHGVVLPVAQAHHGVPVAQAHHRVLPVVQAHHGVLPVAQAHHRPEGHLHGHHAVHHVQGTHLAHPVAAQGGQIASVGVQGGHGVSVDYVAHPKYHFEYGVTDHKTKDNHSQKESRDGDVVVGEYSLQEPGGNIRTVKYVADHNGFQAHVLNSNGNDHSGANQGVHRGVQAALH